jgi:hypothetical protein
MLNLQLAIQSNPLESTTFGETAGFLAFDLAVQAAVSARAHT